MFESVKELVEAHKGLKKEVYLDIENSTPVPKEIIEEMLPYFNEKAYGHPALTHKPGWEAYETIMEISSRMSKFINASNPEEINFTHSETEANNLALIGCALANKENGKKIIISEIEPLSILHASELLSRNGFKIIKIPVNNEGFIDLDKLSKAIDKETIIVSIMLVNHEIGTIEPIKEAVEIVKDKNQKTIFHTDASDAYGKIPIDVKKIGVDLMSLSSYKILGPRGAGALYVKEGTKIERIIEGQIGTQQLWPDLENVPSLVGFAKASELAFKNFNENVNHMKELRDALINEILSKVDSAILNGPLGEKRAPDNVNISYLHVEGEALTIELSLSGVYVSSGSACTRRILQPSHVLLAIGRKFEEAHGSILMKVTRYHTKSDIDYVLDVLPKAVERLRGITGHIEIGGE
jgi:cysteine desulfurase